MASNLYTHLTICIEANYIQIKCRIYTASNLHTHHTISIDTDYNLQIVICIYT